MKKLFIGLSITVLVFGALSAPSLARAADLTADQIIAALVANPSLLAQLQALLGGTPTVPPLPPPSCTFSIPTRDLHLGDEDVDVNGEVTILQKVFVRSGFLTMNGRTYGFFGNLTQSALIKWQQKYFLKGDAVFYEKDQSGNIYVGPRTRASMDAYRSSQCQSSGIVVTSPTSNSLVKSPLQISGYTTGNQWGMFEGQVGSVELLDSNGNPIGGGARLVVSPSNNYPSFQFYFTGLITWEKTPATPTGNLVFRNENASGLPEDDRKYAVPVRFSNTTVPSPITVVSPNGGETWYLGEKRTIKWSSSGMVDLYAVPYHMNFEKPIWLTKNISGSSYDWIVGQGSSLITPDLVGTYQIFACKSGTDPWGNYDPTKVCDSSDSYFKIAGPSSIVSSPVITSVTPQPYVFSQNRQIQAYGSGFHSSLGEAIFSISPTVTSIGGPVSSMYRVYNVAALPDMAVINLPLYGQDFIIPASSCNTAGDCKLYLFIRNPAASKGSGWSTAFPFTLRQLPATTQTATAKVISSTAQVTSLITPTGNEEAQIKATFTVDVTTGNSEVRIPPKGAIAFTASSSNPVTSAYIPDYTERHTATYSFAGLTVASDGSYVIPANTTKRMTAYAFFNTRYLFSGTYRVAILAVATYSIKIPTTGNYITPQALTIIGEKFAQIHRVDILGNYASQGQIYPGDSIKITGSHFAVGSNNVKFTEMGTGAVLYTKTGVPSTDGKTLTVATPPASIIGARTTIGVQVQNPSTPTSPDYNDGWSNLRYLYVVAGTPDTSRPVIEVLSSTAQVVGDTSVPNCLTQVLTGNFKLKIKATADGLKKPVSGDVIVFARSKTGLFRSSPLPVSVTVTPSDASILNQKTYDVTIDAAYKVPSYITAGFLAGNYYISLDALTTRYLNGNSYQDLDLAVTPSVSLSGSSCGTPPAPVLSEQVKCVFNGATTAQSCYSTTAATFNTPSFSCTSVNSGSIGACVANVTGDKGVPLTWKSSCDQKTNPVTTIDGTNETVTFNCPTPVPVPVAPILVKPVSVKFIAPKSTIYIQRETQTDAARYWPQNLIDGNTGTHAYASAPYLGYELDLGGQYSISDVKINWGRFGTGASVAGSNGEYVRNYYIYGLTASGWVLLDSRTSGPLETTETSIGATKAYSISRIAITSGGTYNTGAWQSGTSASGSVGIFEVQIYGSPAQSAQVITSSQTAAVINLIQALINLLSGR